ncbi:MAG: Rab family GTPase [Gammaproteobacteria bacterium]|jgi:small GTP-binding protein
MPKHKIVLIGNMGSGKTSLVNGYTDVQFNEKEKPTEDHEIKSVQYGNQQLEIWDTAGKPQYRSKIASLLENVSSVMIVIDLNSNGEVATQVAEFKALYDEKFKESISKPLLVLVGTKSDLDHDNIKSSELKDYAEKYKINCAITSAKNASDVEKIFECIRIVLTNQSQTTFESYHQSALAFRFLSNSNEVGNMYYQMGMINISKQTSTKTEHEEARNFMVIASHNGNELANQWLRDHPISSATSAITTQQKKQTLTVQENKSWVSQFSHLFGM